MAGKRLRTPSCWPQHLAGSGYRVRAPRCISSFCYFYATQRPRCKLDIPGRHQSTTLPGRGCSASLYSPAQVQAPAPPPSSSPSSCPPRRTNGCVPVVQKSSSPESPGQALSEFMMRETALPSSPTLSHTVRRVRAGPRNQQPTQPPRESVGSSWLLGTVCQREASSAAYLSRLCLCVR